MPSNYEEISQDNEKRYGTEIGRIGQMLLADRYDDRTHFIFELLQNAEDALKRRGDWNGPRHVNFKLEPGRVTLSHFGRPFDGDDVRGICGIAESTKDASSIGRFGIGFKSVYTFTDCPEIHSGDEDFVIHHYVLPTGANLVSRQDNETAIVLPLKTSDKTAEREIADGFKRLGPGALLFLREIEEINWSGLNGETGAYLRSPPEPLGPNVHRVTLVGEATGQEEVDQNWLVFHRNVTTFGGDAAGKVEVAFQVQPDDDEVAGWAISPVSTSPLVVFFPTALETNLGFLVQGPFKTTPSRDNIPRQDLWNRHLVEQTGELLVDALRWMRDEKIMSVAVLRCLPLDEEKFPEGSMFEPLYEEVRRALTEEPLLPAFDGSYVSAACAKLGRTKELRALFSSEQLSQLFDQEDLVWLSGDITPDRAQSIRDYVVYQLDVDEVTPDAIVQRLSQTFLEEQSDEWIARLYEFLNSQQALKKRLVGEPLVRLADGRHVAAQVNGEPQAFLPSHVETGFPTVCPAVCANPEARSFLISLGLTEPDLIDDVVINILRKYRGETVEADGAEYAQDISRIVTAFKSESSTEGQKNKLKAALCESSFVMVVDPGDDKGYVAKPGDVYVATDRLTKLYAGVSGVLLVDAAYSCLRGEDVRELLEACGALRYPRPVRANDAMSSDERREVRRKAGHENSSGYSDHIVDWTLSGVDELFEHLASLSPQERRERARLLWDSLADLEDRRGHRVFEGSYSWSHHGKYETTFPSAFVRRLNSFPWVPDADGDLHRPHLVVFDSLGWKSNPFLLDQIKFKPAIIDQLAQETGIDPAALDLLRTCGITSVEELRARLGIVDDVDPEDEPPGDNGNPEADPTGPSDVYDDATDLYGDDMPEIPPGSYDPEGGDSSTSSGGTSAGRKPGSNAAGNTGSNRGGAGTGSGKSSGQGSSGGRGGDARGDSKKGGGMKPFISYVGTHPDDKENDPDGLDHADRMKVEEQAIIRLLQHEPALQRTPEGNPGFDLFEADRSGRPIRWVEIKSMTGGLDSRPVCLSRAQFEMAWAKRADYWLYVVEYATDPAAARVQKIQDPAGRARSYTFDRGWCEVAQAAPLGDRKDL